MFAFDAEVCVSICLKIQIFSIAKKEKRVRQRSYMKSEVRLTCG